MRLVRMPAIIVCRRCVGCADFACSITGPTFAGGSKMGATRFDKNSDSSATAFAQELQHSRHVSIRDEEVLDDFGLLKIH